MPHRDDGGSKVGVAIVRCAQLACQAAIAGRPSRSGIISVVPYGLFSALVDSIYFGKCRREASTQVSDADHSQRRLLAAGQS